MREDVNPFYAPPCFRTRKDKPSLDNSLLRFAMCSRRTHSLLITDEPWWEQQCLCLDMQRPLIPVEKCIRLSRNDGLLALMVDGFLAPQQVIARRLLGDEVYEREVAPTLREVRKVRQQEKTYDVYPQLTPAFFDSLAHEEDSGDDEEDGSEMDEGALAVLTLASLRAPREVDQYRGDPICPFMLQ